MKQPAPRILIFSLIAVLTACRGEQPRDEPEEAAKTASAGEVSAEEFRKQQLRFADSVLNSVSATKDVAARLGPEYQVGSVAMRDTIAALAARTDCFSSARKTDPYLAGTVTFWVNMSVIGTDHMQVMEAESKWTSAAGNIANACLNQAARTWKLSDVFGKPAAYVVQVQFK